MDYIKKTYTDKAIEVQISSFAGKGGVTEYHVLLTITDRTLPFSGQLQNIQRAYVAVIQEMLPDDATAVFRRYFLSDAANQADLVMVWGMRKFLLPSFHRGASSTKRQEQNSHVDLVFRPVSLSKRPKTECRKPNTTVIHTILDRGLLQ